jgi:translation initiation factor 1 (eIF-1/SUI1)
MAKAKIPVDGTSTAPLSTSPFAALASVRASLPDVPVPEAVSSTAAPAKEAAKFGPKVVVRKEKKGHGGKTATVVSGVLPAHLDDICGALKTKLGSGARIDGDDIVVQGDVVDRVIAFLQTAGAKKVVKGSG